MTSITSIALQLFCISCIVFPHFNSSFGPLPQAIERIKIEELGKIHQTAIPFHNMWLGVEDRVNESYSSYFFLKWLTDMASKYVSATKPARMALKPV